MNNMEELKHVFKVVKKDRHGRYFSANTNAIADENLMKAAYDDDYKGEVIEYRVNFMTKPRLIAEIQCLFACQDITTARKWRIHFNNNLIEAHCNEVVILSCLAGGNKPYDYRDAVFDKFVQQHSCHPIGDIDMTGVCLCDYVIPLHEIKY